MSKSFLPIAQRRLGSVQSEGDQQGGAVGPDSRGLPTGVPNNFWFATGVECSYPTIQEGRLRRDLLYSLT